MKHILKTVLVTIFAVAQIGFSQGFINLNFEQANVVPIPDGDYGANSIAVTNALPGWTAYFGTEQQSQVTYNDPALGSTFVTLDATNGSQLSGNYSVGLQGGATFSAATISQTGLIPTNAETLTFIAADETTLGTAGLQVSLDGQDLSWVVVSNELNYTVYGANISAFAGQTETLAFSALEASSGYNNWEIDDIQFSTSPVPEPGPLALCTTGGLLLGLRWRKKFLA